MTRASPCGRFAGQVVARRSVGSLLHFGYYWYGVLMKKLSPLSILYKIKPQFDPR